MLARPWPVDDEIVGVLDRVSATDGEDVGTVAGNSIAGMPTKEQSRTDTITEPGDTASIGEERVQSETSEAEEHNNAAEEPAPVGRDRSQQVAAQVKLQIYPDADPYSDREPLWARGGFQLMALIASMLPDIPNKEQITGRVLEVIDALAPTLLSTPIPEEQRGKIMSLLRYCGYKDFCGSARGFLGKSG